MQDMLYTVPEVAKILKTNVNCVYALQRAGVLTFMRLGRLKCRKTTLEAFLEKYDGKDLNDLNNIKDLEIETGEEDGNDGC